jgi:hypothetical protein
MTEVTLSIEDEDATVAAFAELADYNLAEGALRKEPWIEITNIAPVRCPFLLAGTRYQIDIPDRQISFVGCMARDNADPTRFLAMDVMDFTGKSILSRA